MATPLTVGRMLNQRFRPALPFKILLNSAFPTCPIVAQQNFSNKRTSPEGSLKVTKFFSRAKICANVPAERAILPPFPGLFWINNYLNVKLKIKFSPCSAFI